MFTKNQIRSVIRSVLKEVITVTSKPDDGCGSDWWVGLEGEYNDQQFGIYDNSIVNTGKECKDVAEKCARECREALEKLILERFADS